MNRNVVGLVAIVMLTLAGCEKNAEPTMAKSPDPGASLDNLDAGRRDGGLAANDSTLPVTATPPAESRPPAETAGRGGVGGDDDAVGGDETLTPTRSKSGRAARTAKQAPRAKTYVVKKGDSLSKIAKKMYGDADRWTEIWNANKGRIKDKNKLTVGQKLTIP